MEIVPRCMGSANMMVAETMTFPTLPTLAASPAHRWPGVSRELRLKQRRKVSQWTERFCLKIGSNSKEPESPDYYNKLSSPEPASTANLKEELKIWASQPPEPASVFREMLFFMLARDAIAKLARHRAGWGLLPVQTLPYLLMCFHCSSLGLGCGLGSGILSGFNIAFEEWPLSSGFMSLLSYHASLNWSWSNTTTSSSEQLQMTNMFRPKWTLRRRIHTKLGS